MQDVCLVVEVMLNRADACPSLRFKRDGKFYPRDPGVRSCEMSRHVVARAPCQLFGPFGEGLPMLIRYNVFAMVSVLSQVSDNTGIHGGIVSNWWFNNSVVALCELWWSRGPCISWRLLSKIINGRWAAVPRPLCSGSIHIVVWQGRVGVELFG